MDEINITIPEPNDRQKLFLADRHRYVAFGGARGGGKSWAIRTKAILLGYGRPGITQTIIRRTYPELYKNHIKPMLQFLPQGAYRYNDGRKELTFPNGSTILFGYCNNDRDLLQYQGNQTDILYIDEATQFTEEQFRVLNSSVRGTGDFPRRTYLTCNPGGVGHGWVKRLFVDRLFEGKENPDDYSFIRSRLVDNKILMEAEPDYVATLEALPYKLRQAWLEGDWNIFEGQFFEEFRDDPTHYKDRQYTHVIAPFDVPDDWTIYRSFDWGYAKPFSCGWWAVDYDNVAYRILELYGCSPHEANTGLKWTATRVFSEIARIEREHRWLRGKQIIGVADPAIWASDTGQSVYDDAMKQGVVFTKGDNQRIPGWLQMHYRFAFDDNGYPMMYVFENCKGFIRTIPQLIYDEYHVEDLDTDGEDHIADETRYFCMARPISPTKAAAEDPFLQNPVHTILDVDKADLAPPPTRGGRMEVIR